MICWLALCFPVSEALRSLHRPGTPLQGPPPASRLIQSEAGVILRGGKNLRIMEGLSASIMSLNFCPKVGGSQVMFLSSGMIWLCLCIRNITLVSV